MEVATHIVDAVYLNSLNYGILQSKIFLRAYKYVAEAQTLMLIFRGRKSATAAELGKLNLGNIIGAINARPSFRVNIVY